MPRALLLKSDQNYISYASSLEEQFRDVEGISSTPDHPYVLHFLEHKPVITLGKATEPEHLKLGREKLVEMGYEFFESTRGGSVTYHGPGQLTAYIHVNLRELKISFRELFRLLEDWLICVLQKMGVAATVKEGKTGVWTESGKICALGLAAKKFVTYHGFSFNIDVPESQYDVMIPCGLKGEKVTSLNRLTSRPYSRKEVEALLIENLPSEFSGRLMQSHS